MSDKPQENNSENLANSQPSEIAKSTSELPDRKDSPQTISTSPIIEGLKTIPISRLALLGIILTFTVGTLVLFMKGHVSIAFCIFGCGAGETGGGAGGGGGVIIPLSEIIALIATGGTLFGLTSLAGIAAIPAVGISAVVWLLFHVRV